MYAYGLVYFGYLFLYSGLEFTLSFLTHLRFQYDSMKQGRMYFFVGILMFILQGYHIIWQTNDNLISASYVRRIPNARQYMGALIGIALIIPGYLLISIAQQQTIFYLGLAFYSLGKVEYKA